MKLTVVCPEPYEGAFANPMRGFRARWWQVDGSHPQNPRLSTVREYFPWNMVEPDAAAGVDAILAATEEKCPDLPGRNLRLIPRVFLESPQGGRDVIKRVWPADMTPDFASPEFLRRAERLIEKMGAAWNGDPRIAGIEMGLYGFWGEQHLFGNRYGLPPRMPQEIQRVLGDAFAAAFPDKQVMVRYGDDFLDYDFGFYWDSFALGTAMKEVPTFKARGDFWRRRMFSGETAYDYGDVRQTLGADPTDTVRTPYHRRWLIDWIRDMHASCIGWISRYDPTDPAVFAAADEAEVAFGYRFVADEFAYTADVAEDGAFSCRLTLCNVGSAPFYYEWPVTLSLLDPATGQPVFAARMQGDIRSVQPGDEYDHAARAYRVPPEPVTFTLDARLPDRLRGGAFLAAVSVDDPSCGRPALRLACRNYLRGGRHPLGVVRWGKEAALPPFDDLQADQTIHYQ